METKSLHSFAGVACLSLAIAYLLAYVGFRQCHLTTGFDGADFIMLHEADISLDKQRVLLQFFRPLVYLDGKVFGMKVVSNREL